MYSQSRFKIQVRNFRSYSESNRDYLAALIQAIRAKYAGPFDENAPCTRIAFVCDQNLNIEKFYWAQRSGLSEQDQSALKATREGLELLPIPNELIGQKITVEFKPYQSPLPNPNDLPGELLSLSVTTSWIVQAAERPLLEKYCKEIGLKIQSKFEDPLTASNYCALEFSLRPDGAIDGKIMTAKSSNRAAHLRAAINAVREASPFPRFPFDEMLSQRFQVQFLFTSIL